MKVKGARKNADRITFLLPHSRTSLGRRWQEIRTGSPKGTRIYAFVQGGSDIPLRNDRYEKIGKFFPASMNGVLAAEYGLGSVLGIVMDERATPSHLVYEGLDPHRLAWMLIVFAADG